MRTIKFRGKRVDNGKWVYGDLQHRAGGQCAIVVPEPDGNGVWDYAAHFVDPNTVGQFTGLTDKNGKEIYEGDIVKAKYTKRAKVKYLDVHFCVDFNGYQALIGGEEYEVVGNIHDKKGGNDENY